MNITFSQGTLLIESDTDTVLCISHLITYDERIKFYRAQACNYSEIILTLRKNNIQHNDYAKSFQAIDINFKSNFEPRKHQLLALQRWKASQYCGVVVMPTGSGKSYFAFMAMNYLKRSTLIVVPTIDLMQQWSTQLETYFNTEIGMLGGGEKKICDITVTTYDSAVIHMEFIGNKFGFIIFDECHHLPGPNVRLSASMCIAPYRLGLTATPERADGEEQVLYSLVGPTVYEVHIDELDDNILAPYTTKKLFIDLEPDEEEKYNSSRKIYTDFIKRFRINFNSRNGWQEFIIKSATYPGGKEAFKAYLEQKNIARTAKNKFKTVWELIIKNKGERIIIFTADNDTAYKLGNSFFLPVITHKTKLVERKLYLEKFKSGEFPVIITSKVLNEGVDVPEASIGIIVSGSASIREHVQRLGRILRAKNNKRAVLYELISENTSEVSISERRRKHRAYSYN